MCWLVKNESILSDFQKTPNLFRKPKFKQISSLWHSKYLTILRVQIHKNYTMPHIFATIFPVNITSLMITLTSESTAYSEIIENYLPSIKNSGVSKFYSSPWQKVQCQKMKKWLNYIYEKLHSCSKCGSDFIEREFRGSSQPPPPPSWDYKNCQIALAWSG